MRYCIMDWAGRWTLDAIGVETEAGGRTVVQRADEADTRGTCSPQVFVTAGPCQDRSALLPRFASTL